MAQHNAGSGLNWRLLTVVLVISVAIIVACVLAGSGYFGIVVKPTVAANTAVVATANWAMTPRTVTPSITLSPTLTPSPTLTLSPTYTMSPTTAANLVSCPAEVEGENALLLKYPGYGNGTERLSALANSAGLNVIGILDDGWYWIETGNERGWIKQESIAQLDANACTPNEYDLHYMLYPNDQTSRFVLEDTFSKGKNVWQDDRGNLLKIESNNRESYLELPYGDIGLALVSTTNPALTKLSNVRVFSSFTFERTFPSSYIGFRFLETGASNYEFDFFPQQCQVILKKDNVEILFERKIDGSACIDRYYNISMNLVGGELEISINDSKFSYSPQQLSDSEEGALRIVVNDASVRMDHVVVMAPK